MLAALIAPRFFGQTGRAKVEVTKQQVATLESAVAMFEQHVWASLGASNGPASLAALTAELGRPGMLRRLRPGHRWRAVSPSCLPGNRAQTSWRRGAEEVLNKASRRWRLR